MAARDTARIHEKVKFKRNRVLRAIRRAGRLGRLDLARRLRLSNTRVCEIVQQLLDERLVLEEHTGKDRRGRLPVPVELNPAHGHLAGFDMEARRLRMVVVDFQGRPVWQTQRKLAAPDDRGRLIGVLLDFIESGLDAARSRFKRLLGIGLAAPGVVDARAGAILHYDLLKAARDIPLRDLVAARTGLPAVLEDNIRMLTLAEWMAGAGQHLASFVCVAVRSGVAAGVVIDGRLFTGSHGFAGKAGYMPLPDGSSAARWKSLVRAVSEPALGVDVEAADFDLPPAKARRAGELLGSQLASMAILFDPEAIVLAGGLLRAGGPLWDPMERSFRRFVLPEMAARVPLLPARVGPFAAAIGATHCCFEFLHPIEPAPS